VTPGAFLRAARQAVGLTTLDVALKTETTPPRPASARARLVDAIEDDLVRPLPVDLLALQAIYGFDREDFERATGSSNVPLAKPVLRRVA
jgi:hypothetical protein